jgi:hypothetical protein
LTDNPTCERFVEGDESATHILCDCEAIAYLRFRYLDQFFVEPSDYYDALINKVLYFIGSVGLIKDYSKGEGQYIIEGRGARAGFHGTPYTYIHTYIHPIYLSSALDGAD